MSLTIHESFKVRVPPDRAWRFLIDPEQVVRCLPGAELTETVDARTYRGRVKVRIGPISTMYDGTATLTEVNETDRLMRMAGEGREVGNAGSARMKMAGKVSADGDGGSLVDVDATIDIAGRVMQFGRGLVESVSRQLFKQFAEAVRETLERQEVEAPAETEVIVPGEPSTAQAVEPEPSRELRIMPLLWRGILDWAIRLFRRV